MMSRPLALTIGEPAGIGPDIALAAWRRRGELHLPPFYLLASPEHLARRAAHLGWDIPLRTTDPENAASQFSTALPVVDIGCEVTAEPGKPDASSAPAAIAAIREAADNVLQGRAAAMVTNPIAKAVLYQAGFTEPGHTEYLAKLSEAATKRPVQPVMMLWSPELAVVPVTIHIPLRDVPRQLTTDLIVRTAEIVAHDLRRLIAEGLDARGPLPADTLFHEAARATYDVALCMYHDQALIPIKTLAFDHGVNVTLGLPFVRTSPDHGTAFDIAGTGRASPSSLIAAILLAARLAATEAVAAPVQA
jgi:4-hydroxythreonine-4-phosphate dehydrogenase